MDVGYFCWRHKGGYVLLMVSQTVFVSWRMLVLLIYTSKGDVGWFQCKDARQGAAWNTRVQLQLVSDVLLRHARVAAYRGPGPKKTTGVLVSSPATTRPWSRLMNFEWQWLDHVNQMTRLYIDFSLDRWRPRFGKSRSPALTGWSRWIANVENQQRWGNSRRRLPRKDLIG